MHWDRRLDGLIAQAMCSIPSVKGVELGAAVLAAQSPGSAVHDEPRWDAERGFHHLTNRQGGLAGGVTDGEPVWALVHFKPISTLLHPLRSVDIRTGAEINAHYERSDICVVPAGAVVAEAMLAWVLAAAAVEKFGGDTAGELRRAAAAHRRAVQPAAMNAVRRIALVGLPGSGKSTVAPLVAARLGWASVDLDDEIASSTGRSPAAIIATDGEAHFRDLELTALEDALRRPGPVVIACGGGLITQAAALRLLTELCTVVWLDAPDEVLIERVGDGANRPTARRIRGGRDSASAQQPRSSPPVLASPRRR